MSASPDGPPPHGVEVRRTGGTPSAADTPGAYTLEFVGSFPDHTGQAKRARPGWFTWKVRLADGRSLDAGVPAVPGARDLVELGPMRR